MPKFDTLLAGKSHSVQYVVKPDKSLCIIKITGRSFDGMRDAQTRAVLTRIRKECIQHHEGTLFAWQREHAAKQKALHHAYTGWFNGADFKEYFKLRAEEGGSLVFEVADYEVYCIGAREAAEESKEYFGENA